MFWHLVLGFLRDGRPRHGYELITEYKGQFGEKLNPGNLYRELSRLAGEGLVKNGVNPPGADPRRIPYQITERGRAMFDQWLSAPSSRDGDFPAWLVFIDRVPADVRARVLDRCQEDFWLRGKALARQREDALAGQAGRSADRYDPLPALLSRRMKLLAAELESLKEFRQAFDGWLRSRPPGEEPEAPAGAQRRRDKGSRK